MAKKYFTYGYKVKSEEIKKNNQDTVKRLQKANKIESPQDLLDIGIYIKEGANHETATLNKKVDAELRLEKAIDIIIECNALIEAYNRRLKDINPKRYKDLEITDNTLKLYTEEGKEFFKEGGFIKR